MAVVSNERCGEKFPRFSSEFRKKRKRLEEMKYVEVILEPGDVMYIPRGTIHEAFCITSEDNNDGKKDRSEFAFDDFGESAEYVCGYFRTRLLRPALRIGKYERRVTKMSTRNA